MGRGRETDQRETQEEVNLSRGSMAKIHKRKVRPKRKSKHLTNVAQKHITRRIGTHQRAAQKHKEARKRARRQK